MTFEQPTPFAEAVDKLRRRGVLPVDLGSAEWRGVPVEIRERAFFSAHVENARLLQAMRDELEDWMSGARDPVHGGLKATGRAEFVAAMRELAIAEGLGRVDPATGAIDPEIREDDLRDIRSLRRLQLIFDTQTEAAQEYGYWLQGQDPDLLWAFPCSRFIRVRPVMVPRPYHQANEGAVRRKDDLAFWLDMNRDFGVPWGPWGFSSGMGTEDVDRDEAVALGAIGPDEVGQPLARQFNEGLDASLAGLDGELAEALRQATGGTAAGGRLKPGGVAAEPDQEEEHEDAAWPSSFAGMEEAKEAWRTFLGVDQITTSAGSEARTWGAKFRSNKRLLEHLHRVGAEFDRMVRRWPKLHGKLREFLAVASKRGRATIDGPHSRMSTKAVEWDEAIWDNRRQWEAQNRRSIGSERRGTQVIDNFRHELGHTLSTPEAMQEFRALRQANGWNLQWVRDNVSHYAGRNDAEAFAEAFGIWTREDYRPGTLPGSLEDFFRKLVE